MKLNIFQKIGIGLGVALLLYILFSTLLKNSVSHDNLDFVKGQIDSIERFKLNNRWSVSYDIRLANKSSEFKIKPEYYDCVDAQEVELKQLVGQQVTLGIGSDKGLNSDNLKDVVSLKIGDKEYINLICVNEKIESDKWQIPLILIGFAILIPLIYLGNKRLKKK